MVNKLQPTIVVITGDLATRKSQLPRVLKELQNINCRAIYFVPGNYEREEAVFFRKRRFSTEEYEDIMRALLRQGITVLDNSSATVNVGGKQVCIYGFDNSIYGNERVKMTNEQLQHHDYVILLAHSPTIMDKITRKRIFYHLVLVGHTHGGQIRVGNRTIGAYKHCHVGLKRMGGAQYFYINRGLGTVKIPVRLNCFPEIASFQVGSKNTAECVQI